MAARSGLASAIFALGLGLAGGVRADAVWTAAAHGETDRLIKAAGAEALFVNEPHGSLLGARHLKSGLLCTFSPGDRINRILVFERAEPRLPRGDDVGCTSQVSGVHHSLSAARLGERGGVDAALRRAVANLMTAAPNAVTYQGDHAENAEVDVDGRPLPLAEHRTARFVVERDGRKLFTRVSVAVVDGWDIKQRVTGPLEEAVALDVEAEAMMTLVLVDFAMNARTAAARAALR